MFKKLVSTFGSLWLATASALAQPPGGPQVSFGAPSNPTGTVAAAPPVAPTTPPRSTLASLPPPPSNSKDFLTPPAGTAAITNFPGTGRPAAPPGYQPTAISNSCCSFDRTGCYDEGERWSDNLSVYAGIDGAKEPADVGINANFGYRLALNLGLPLIEEAGIGLQIGSALNYNRTAVRVMRFIDGTAEHTQSFSTIGLFQRTESGFNWGVVYDYRWDDYYDRFTTSQWRAQVGIDVSDDDQIGVWGTLRQGSARASLAGLPLSLSPLNQINLFWRHVWPNEAATRVWVGFTENHGRFNYLIPFEPPVRHPFCFGADMHIPLNDSLAIFGEAQFITPNDSGTVCATLGVAWYPGAARCAARARFAPYQNVANNATMPLDLRANFEVFALSGAAP